MNATYLHTSPAERSPRPSGVSMQLELAEACTKIAANQIMDLCGVSLSRPDRAMKNPVGGRQNAPRANVRGS